MSEANLKLQLQIENINYSEQLSSQQYLLDNDYFYWLDKYTSKVDFIGTKKLNYISPSHNLYNKVSYIRILFNMINNFANENDIKSNNLIRGFYYLCSINGAKYQIGCYAELSKLDYYCIRLADNTIGEFIDINDIKKQNTKVKTK